jgi:hypothetical protein
MRRHLLLFVAVFAFLSQSATAQCVDCTSAAGEPVAPPEWGRCSADTDCVFVCARTGAIISDTINSRYAAGYEKFFGCGNSQYIDPRHGPYITVCEGRGWCGAQANPRYGTSRYASLLYFGPIIVVALVIFVYLFRETRKEGDV